MYAVPATRAKLAEAQFFHRKLLEVGKRHFSPEPEGFGYYLSAFVSAARSVTFALQCEHKPEYDAWFPAWKNSLENDKRALLEEFNAHRIAEVHQGGMAITHELAEISMAEYYLAASSEGVQVHIFTPFGVPRPKFHRAVRTLSLGGTQAEVMGATGTYFALLTDLVNAFQAHYGATAA